MYTLLLLLLLLLAAACTSTSCGAGQCCCDDGCKSAINNDCDFTCANAACQKEGGLQCQCIKSCDGGGNCSGVGGNVACKNNGEVLACLL
jgi:hypothetical protein